MITYIDSNLYAAKALAIMYLFFLISLIAVVSALIVDEIRKK